MTLAPIYDAVRLTRFLIVPALDALTTAGVYWWVAPQTATRPFVVVFPQDMGGVSVLRLGSQGWSSMITVKAVADTLSAAETLLAQVAPAMDSLSAPATYDLRVQFVRPLALPPDAQGIHQVGGIWDVSLERE